MCQRPGCEVEYGSECDCLSEDEIKEFWIVFNTITGDEEKFTSFYEAIAYAQLHSKIDYLNDPNLAVTRNYSNTVFTIGNYSIYYNY